ncbi:hypothetical protein SK128_012255 [Halocaridina rubra]|uniref:Uncharacterized protein n=1 Tax=Halocaridina rubra TaxID=373956 RepID=A0AAN8WPB7_HALRR
MWTHPYTPIKTITVYPTPTLPVKVSMKVKLGLHNHASLTSHIPFSQASVYKKECFDTLGYSSLSHSVSGYFDSYIPSATPALLESCA